MTAAELDKAGERIWNLSRLFNTKNGFGAAEDSLPEKVLKNPLRKGPNAGKTFDPEDFSVALNSYYKKRGWDEQGGGLVRRNWLSWGGLIKFEDGRRVV